MNIKEIRELVQLIEESSAVEEFEMERAGVRIRIKKTLLTPPASSRSDQPSEPIATEAQIAASPASPEQKQETHFIFEAPIVGTFYLTPKPDVEPFVKIGDQVGKGTVLCINEAMKIINQIESEVDGKIVRILVENGQPVEYGQPLFEIQVTA